MQMYFEFNEYVRNLLVYGWTTHNHLEFAGTCVAVFVTAFLVEGVKVLRDGAGSQAGRSPLADPAPRADRPAFLAPLAIPTSVRQVRVRRICYRLLELVCYLLQIVMAYAAMLFVMTYNAWLLLATCLGYMLGYLLFADVGSAAPPDSPPRTPAWPDQETNIDKKGRVCSYGAVPRL